MNPNPAFSPLPPTALARLLDANLNRAREGLRVIEDWCRFGLDSAELTERCKQIRQELAPWHGEDLRQARDTAGDVGAALSHPQEELRQDLQAVLLANLCRAQESLRVLEEYGKLRDPEMGKVCKRLRYQVYILETELFRPRQNRLERLKAATLYLVTSPQPHLLATVEAALAGGLTLVQYRDKTAEDGQRYALASELARLCRQYGALFLVNDRPDLALAVGADGVHLGPQDLPIAVARNLLGPDLIIGRSTTNPKEMVRALQEGADYIGAGPIYSTPTKVGKAAAGLEYAKYVRDHASVPWFAIGGIDSGNLDAVLGAGAKQVAVVRAIMEAPDPRRATQDLLQKLSAVGEGV
ncbi:MAG: thiamine phosphate synthase [Cyanobacteriota bacterium]